jgi:integrase
MVRALQTSPSPPIARQRDRKLRELAAMAESFAQADKADNTRRSYASAYASFSAYCKLNDLDPLPASPQTYVLYLTNLADLGRKISTIRVHAAAIRDAHVRAGQPLPGDDAFAKRFLVGLENTIGEPPVKKDALTADLLLPLMTARAKPLQEKRDRAIVLLGFAMGARRSELAALNVGDIRFERGGIVVMTRRSKTDRRGRGHERGVPRLDNPDLCAVRALKTWLRAAEITRGPVFRTFTMQQELQRNRIDPRDVERAVKRVTGSKLVGDFAGHSLRSGYITSAARADVGLPSIMGHTGHKTANVVMGYVKRSKILEESGLATIANAVGSETHAKR